MFLTPWNAHIKPPCTGKTASVYLKYSCEGTNREQKYDSRQGAGRQDNLSHPIPPFSPTLAPVQTRGEKCRRPNRAWYGKGKLSSTYKGRSLSGRRSTSLTAFYLNFPSTSVLVFHFYFILSCTAVSSHKTLPDTGLGLADTSRKKS